MKRLASEMLGEGVADPFAGPMTEGTTGVLFPFEEVAKKAVQVPQRHVPPLEGTSGARHALGAPPILLWSFPCARIDFLSKASAVAPLSERDCRGERAVGL